MSYVKRHGNTVRDMAILCWKFEKDKKNEEAEAVMSPQLVKCP